MEEEQELTPEEIKKEEARNIRIKKKMEAFMLDVGMDMLDDKSYLHAKDQITKYMSKAGLPVTISYVKAFKEGMQMGLGAHQQDNQFSVMLLCSLTRFYEELAITMKTKVDKSMSNPEAK